MKRPLPANVRQAIVEALGRSLAAAYIRQQSAEESKDAREEPRDGAMRKS